MKNIFKIFLSLTILISPLGAMAKDPVPVPANRLEQIVVENAKKFRAEFAQAVAADPKVLEQKIETVVYDLEHLEDVVKDLIEPMSQAASNGLTEEVVAEVTRRFEAAVALLTSIMMDKKISDAKKKDYVSDLAAAISQVFYRVLIQHDQEGNKKIEELKGLTLGQILREFWIDFESVYSRSQAVVMNRVDANGNVVNDNETQYVHSIRDRMRRTAMTLELTQILQESLFMTLQKLESDDIVEAKFIPTYYGEKEGPRFLAYRSNRLGAEQVARGTYVGMALWGFLAPAIDAVGMAIGRDENTLFASSVIYLGIWGTIAAAKSLTISDRSVVELKKLLDIAKKRDGVVPTRGKITGFWARVRASIGATIGSCQIALGGTKVKPDLAGQ